jgi:hypothetical protein
LGRRSLRDVQPKNDSGAGNPVLSQEGIQPLALLSLAGSPAGDRKAASIVRVPAAGVEF